MLAVFSLLCLLLAPVHTQAGPFQRGSGGGVGGGANRQALRQELMNLPPDQRRARMQQLRQQFMQNGQQQMSQKQQQFRDRWNRATPDQRTKFCGSLSQKCGGGAGQGEACQTATSLCGGKGQ